ncbi:MAG: deoxyguanosinetriphosphate triphosphohydrolase [Phycisphaerae bacterium]|nr:deoxyguanosinetriphosphate triphosphohydrolase [Phycisphaerae bacterium]MDD5380597.1 deoxyguanosinetriphosphate triphosphohydrolase [Phycisphaerae bacterium]
MPEELVCYAVSETRSRGRKFPEKPHPYRTDFERDRDRIIHCSAFRRLEGKTQVFTPGLDDYYRTRLTHSIEVAQIGRTIAKELRLNINLTEAICLAHDLGHSPFGHAGEKTLNRLMADFGGFEHNLQALRIVDLLEHLYPDFPGLNLMYETRLGLAKHRSPYDNPKDDTFAEPNCSLEGQVADIADRIAVNSHDLEDGMRAGLIHREQLKNVEIFTEAQNRINAEEMEDPVVQKTRTAKAIIDILVGDCIDVSKKTIAGVNPKTVDEVAHRSENLITLSDESNARLAVLEKFLLQNFYQHKTVTQTAKQIEDWLQQLFEEFCRRGELMPGYFQKLIPRESLQRTVCDYIAGMTDRFCLKCLENPAETVDNL